MKKVQRSELSVQNNKKTIPYTLYPILLDKGFTLIEALISAAILAVVGIIMVSLLNQSFQLNTKSQIISKIKQNGQNALSIMGEAVRNAESVKCIYPLPPDPLQPAALTLNRNGVYTRFILHTPTPNINGYINVSTPTNPDICNASTGTNQSVLTDTDKITGVSLQKGAFTINSASNNITIDFDLGPAVNSPDRFDSRTSLVHFRTTLNVRNR